MAHTTTGVTKIHKHVVRALRALYLTNKTTTILQRILEHSGNISIDRRTYYNNRSASQVTALRMFRCIHAITFHCIEKMY